MQRVEALRYQIKNAGVVEIVEEGVVERFKKVGVFRILGRGFEVGCGEADLFNAEAGAGADPVLSEGCRDKQKNCYQHQMIASGYDSLKQRIIFHACSVEKLYGFVSAGTMPALLPIACSQTRTLPKLY